MALFRRTSKPAASASQTAAIAGFWQWWTGAAARTAQAIADHDPGRMVAEISSQVHAMDGNLAWELAAGTTSQHVLVVTCAGDSTLRAVARRWLLAAPPADETWQYSDTRSPIEAPDGVVLNYAGHDLDVASVSVAARVNGSAVNVALHHPAYASMSEKDRQSATFLLLDSVIGEQSVETWVGTVDSTAYPPLDPIPLIGLRSVVDGLRDSNLDEDGQPTWALLRGSAPDGTAIVAAAQIPLRSVTAPHLDTHVLLTVPYRDATPDGLPGPESLQALRNLEDHVVQRIATSGRILAHESHQGVRRLHLYVDGTTPAADQIRSAIGGWKDGNVGIRVTADPAWEGVAHLRGS